MRNYQVVFGIDVSKNTLDIYQKHSSELQLQDKTFEDTYLQISNTKKSILKWLKSLSKLMARLENLGYNRSAIGFILEPTGTYSFRIVEHLVTFNFDLSLVNPRQSYGFMQALSMDNKTDNNTSIALAQMGFSLELPLYKAPSKLKRQKKQLKMALRALNKQAQQLSNQLHALAQYDASVLPSAQSALEIILRTVEEQKKALEKELGELDEQEDEDYKTEFKLIKSITGIGDKTARLLLLATGSLKNFQYARQLSKFIGLTPSSHQSGSSVRKSGRIIKKGDSQLRSTLYVATWSAIKYNNACKALYKRLRGNGKPPKKALVAVMNKLVRQAFGVVKSGKPFDNDYYLQFNNF
jgi:transposase